MTSSKILLASICCIFLAVASPVATHAEAADPRSCSGAGPQSPRDIQSRAGTNSVSFAAAPAAADMHLCDIHFHKFAEHKASGFSTLAGEADHEGYVCAGHETGGSALAGSVSDTQMGCGSIAAGDTVEVHWVFTTCDVDPGPKLDSCFSPLCVNPQLRVEAQVFYLTTGDEGALDFSTLAGTAPPPAEGAVQYLGSTTGPSFSDEVCSPVQATWNVRPTCEPLDLAGLDAWCDDNVFGESHAHGVRKLVTDVELLAEIE